MFYKLSNTASAEDISEVFGIPFKYPSLHAPAILFDGNEEVTLPIITNTHSDMISLGIWGILPHKFDNDWESFQRLCNTLNAPINNIGKNNWLYKPLKKRRCLIICTGYFTSFIKGSEVYHHFVSDNKGRPFLLGGIYNHTEDGYLTFSIILSKARPFIEKIQNLSDKMPLSINRKEMQFWLNPETQMDDILHLIHNPSPNTLRAHSISKTLFNNEITYDSMLEPYEYDGVPTGSIDN